jgi:hypothetical protein
MAPAGAATNSAAAAVIANRVFMDAWHSPRHARRQVTTGWHRSAQHVSRFLVS